MPKQVLILTVLAALAVNSFAETAVEPEFPYKASVVGKGVYVRSGSASQYYFTCQLDEPADVIVVDKRFSWCKIVPPAGSFSWVTKEFVILDSNQPGYGIITNDNVRIWAGKADLGPEDSTSPQCKMNKGDKVKLLGEESGDYYKIAPPEDAYLWISGEYLKYAGPADYKVEKPAATVVPAAAESGKADETSPAETVADVNQAAIPTKTPDGPSVSVVTREPEKPKVAKSEYEIAMTKKVYDLIVQIDAERSKTEGRDFGKFIEELKAVAADEKAGMASKYAKYQLERIGGYQLAMQVGTTLEEQQADLEKIRQEIQARRQDLKSKVIKPDEYIIRGKLMRSLVYDAQVGTQRYLIVDGQGKILCYAEPASNLVDADMTGYIGNTVGLKGQAVPDAASGISLVKFAAVDVIE